LPIFYFLFFFFIFVNLREGEKNPKNIYKKRSKYVALDFFAHFLFYFLIQKQKDKKRSKYVGLDFSEKTNPKKR